MARHSRITLPLRRVAALGVSLAVVGAGTIAYAVQQGDNSSATADSASLSATTVPTPSAPWQPTRARVSTFNLLGYGHTMPGKKHKIKTDGRTRQRQANQIIRSNNLQIIGFQEMESPQIDVFNEQLGGQFDLWPGHSYKGKSAVNVKGNSIAWRKDQWTAISKTYYDAPYFKGVNVPRPIVLLQHLVTGQQVYVANTHDPANTFGNASNYRTQAVRRHIATFNALRAASPHIPIVFTGDMNARSEFYCAMTKSTALRAVNGGTRTATKCTLPPSPQIDWILSTPDVQWNGYKSVRTAYVKKTTDHPVIWADATFKSPMAARAGIKRALVVDVQGLPSAAISGSNRSWAPMINSIAAAGASTFDARTQFEPKPSLPNTVSILTGRPVAQVNNGHRVAFGKDRPRTSKYETFAKTTGKYVNTLFDTVHNQGGSTSFMSSDANAAIIIRSAKAGAKDAQGVNYGSNKLTVSSIRSSDAKSMTVIKRQLLNAPRTLSYLQLSGPRLAGEKYGYFSRQYAAAVRLADKRIGHIRNVIAGSAKTATSTALIITSSTGGAQKSSKGTALSQIQVPLIVWGHGVPAGADLYGMNPSFTAPGVARVGYAGPQPLRNSNVANIVTTMLGYPVMPTPTAFGGAINLFQPAALVQRR